MQGGKKKMAKNSFYKGEIGGRQPPSGWGGVKAVSKEEGDNAMRGRKENGSVNQKSYCRDQESYWWGGGRLSSWLLGVRETRS